LRVDAADESTIVDEAAQPGPGTLRSADVQGRGLRQAMHSEGDVQLLGLNVPGLGRIGVCRRPEQHTRIGFEIPVFGKRQHQWPMCPGQLLRRREEEGRATAGLQPDRGHAGKRRKYEQSKGA